jgi:tetratricopeptide (TPR) repeat protein
MAVKRSRITRHVLIGVSLIGAIAGIGAAIFNYQLVQLGKHDEQQAKSREASQQSELARQERVATLLADGIKQAHIGHFSDAENAYSQVLSMDPHNSDALQFKGYLELRQGNIDESIQLLREATRLAPNDPWARYNLSLALARSGDTAGAIAQLRELLKFAPEFRSTVLSDPQFRRLRQQSEVRQLLTEK